MAKGEGAGPIGWDEPPAHAGVAGRSRGHFQMFSLRNLMISLIYFALLSWVGRHVAETHATLLVILLATLIGLGIAGFGLWAALRMTRFAFVGWVIFVVGYMVILGATIGGFAVPSLPILIGSIVYLSHRRRKTYQEGLLRLMDLAARRGMPLAPGVSAFADQSSGVFRIWAGTLAAMLDQGVSLPDAVDALPGVVPPKAALLIRMGQESGDLASGLRAAVRAEPPGSQPGGSIATRVAYLVAVLASGSAIVAFVLYFVIPKFEAIFLDFGVALPGVTVLVIRSSHLLVDFAWIPLLPGLALVAYLAYFFSGPRDLGLPLVDRFFPRRHSALILRSMAVVVDSGRPIVPALREMSQRYPTAWVRKRLGLASGYAEQGVDWSEALGSCDFLSPGDVGVIGASLRTGNLPWALRELADSAERRRAYRLQFWSQVLFALTIGLIGAATFLIAVAFFQPLINLISRLSQ